MSNLFFTKNHEWVKIEDDTAWVGITDYAQKELGDIIFVELPKKGERFKQFSRLGIIESTKSASEIFIPLSGQIIEVNEMLKQKPELINQSPYEEGWIVKIKIEDKEELKNVLKMEFKRKATVLTHITSKKEIRRYYIVNFPKPYADILGLQGREKVTFEDIPTGERFTAKVYKLRKKESGAIYRFYVPEKYVRNMEVELKVVGFVKTT